MTSPIKRYDIAPGEWPTFKEYPSESRHVREQRWADTFKDLAKSQHAWIRNSALSAYFKGMDSKNEEIYSISRHVAALMTQLATNRISANFKLVDQCLKESQYIGLTITYSLGSTSHSLHISNMSPSEYERNT